MDPKRRKFEAQALPHLDAAYNLARWLTRSPADADDIVQEAMLRAYRAFDAVRGGDVRPWLLAIVRNCFYTTHAERRNRKVVPLSDDGDLDGGDPAWIARSPDPEGEAVRTDDGRRLRRVLATLPADFREVLILREMEDLSYREIAEVVGVPIGTVMSRLARGRALLKAAWLRQPEEMRHDVR